MQRNGFNSKKGDRDIDVRASITTARGWVDEDDVRSTPTITSCIEPIGNVGAAPRPIALATMHSAVPVGGGMRESILVKFT